MSMNVLAKNKPEVGLWQATAAIPQIQDHEVLVKINKTAICGTDLHIYNWDQWAQKTIPIPMHVGHEFVGEIVELGAHVKGFAKGDRIAGEGHIVCGYCRNCRAGKQHLCRNTIGIGVNRAGCFAEYLALPASNAYKIPASISDEVASIFDPFGNAVHTALSFDLIGEDVLISGAGPIGLLCVAIARFAGAKKIVISDINPYRLEKAKELGADVALNMQDCPDKASTIAKIKDTMSDLGMKEGFDVALELSGHRDAICASIETLIHGGKMALLGFAGKAIEIDWDTIIWRGIQIKGIYGREMYETWYKMTSMLESGLDISPVITHRFNAKDFQKGFDIMNQGLCGKVILDWI